MLNRVLNGLRYKYEETGPIWESIYIFGWGRYSSLIPSWDSRCAVCGERHGVTYGFRSTLARNGIKGRYATME
jgi:hypothetical protein